MAVSKDKIIKAIHRHTSFTTIYDILRECHIHFQRICMDTDGVGEYKMLQEGDRVRVKKINSYYPKKKGTVLLMAGPRQYLVELDSGKKIFISRGDLIKLKRRKQNARN